MASILGMMVETQSLSAHDTDKLIAFLISFPLSSYQHEKLCKIDAERGYDLSDTKCIELALARMTRCEKIHML